jgi:hypothetical protein
VRLRQPGLETAVGAFCVRPLGRRPRPAKRSHARAEAHPHMLRHACGFALANKGHDTRANNTAGASQSAGSALLWLIGAGLVDHLGGRNVDAICTAGQRAGEVSGCSRRLHALPVKGKRPLWSFWRAPGHTGAAHLRARICGFQRICTVGKTACSAALRSRRSSRRDQTNVAKCPRKKCL